MTMTVRIAVPTFRRHEGIHRLLTALQPQIDLANEREDYIVSIVVIDNDPGASAREVVKSFNARYVHEPRPGIAAVRNASLRECADQTAMILLDDDEVPTDGWLTELMGAFKRHSAEAIAGPVRTVFPPDTPAWVLASGAFIRPVRQDGDRIREAASNNLLLDVGAVVRSGITFNEEFGLTGGSDSLFTREFSAWGADIRWAENALVDEQEDPARFTRSWVLMRAYRNGNTGVRVDRTLARNKAQALFVSIRWLWRGMMYAGAGYGRALIGLLSGSLHNRAAGERTGARGVGMIAAVFGLAHNEYGRRRARMGL